MDERDVIAGVREREAVLTKLLEPLRDHGCVYEIRQRGLMVGIELRREGREPFEPSERIGHRVIVAARKRGVIIRPLGDVVVLMPPLAIPIPDLERLVATTREAIGEVLGT
jgi:adenosylmethionine-8-amino-7-oxononanoate aminotransferase